MVLDTPRCVEVVLFLHLLEVSLLLLGVHLLKCFVGLVIQHDQVPENSQKCEIPRRNANDKSSPVTHVEPREMVTRVLGVEDVLVHYECRASGLRGVAHPDLSDGSVLPKNIIPIDINIVRQVYPELIILKGYLFKWKITYTSDP